MKDSAHTKYWAFLTAKLMAWVAVLWGVRRVLALLMPPPDTFMHQRFRDPFVTDLSYTFIMFGFGLFAAGLLWLIVLDQRYRCRACLRRLRMPVHTGSWTHVLLGAPRTEYICFYGHGTLKVDELQLTGHLTPAWEPNEDIWKELYALEATKR
jgi:hypothetical protein